MQTTPEVIRRAGRPCEDHFARRQRVNNAVLRHHNMVDPVLGKLLRAILPIPGLSLQV